MTNQKNDIDKIGKQYAKRMEECNGDYLTYLKKYNRHTLEFTYTNEQLPKRKGKKVLSSYTFYNEDNCFSHISLIKEFIELVMREENKRWGYKHTDQELIDRIINPIKDRLRGIYDTYPQSGGVQIEEEY